MWRKENPTSLLVKMQISVATMKNSMEVLQKIKNRATILSTNSIPGYLSEENENTNWKRYTNPNVHFSIMHNSQEMETT